jgi:hypothetical protein
VSAFPGTWLAEKLGIEAGARVALVNEPPLFRETLGELPAGVTIGPASGELDVILYFSTQHRDLAERLAELAPLLSRAGWLWVAWAKKVPGVPAAVVEDQVRETAGVAGLVENKLCAIDDTWYGMRFARAR